MNFLKIGNYSFNLIQKEDTHFQFFLVKQGDL